METFSTTGIHSVRKHTSLQSSGYTCKWKSSGHLAFASFASLLRYHPDYTCEREHSAHLPFAVFTSLLRYYLQLDGRNSLLPACFLFGRGDRKSQNASPTPMERSRSVTLVLRAFSLPPAALPERKPQPPVRTNESAVVHGPGPCLRA